MLGFRIGNLSLDSQLVLAPLAGVSDSSFRLVCRENGASLVYTEMVSADGVRRGNKRTLELLSFLPVKGLLGLAPRHPPQHEALDGELAADLDKAEAGFHFLRDVYRLRLHAPPPL